MSRVSAAQTASMIYEAAIGRALAHERTGNYFAAIDEAKRAWDHVDGMMNYARKQGEGEFKTVPCVDLVLRLAPLLFDVASLDELGRVLKAKRSIDRIATDDLAADLVKARAKLQDAQALWKRVRQGELTAAHRSLLLSSKDRDVLEHWAQMGLVVKFGLNPPQFRVATDVIAPTAAICTTCGTPDTAPLVELWGPRHCGRCNNKREFAVVERD